MDDLCIDIRQLVRKAGIDFDYQLCKGAIVSEVDPEKLANAVYCLIANACLYTSPGNEIFVRLLKQTMIIFLRLLIKVLVFRWKFSRIYLSRFIPTIRTAHLQAVLD